MFLAFATAQPHNAPCAQPRTIATKCSLSLPKLLKDSSCGSLSARMASLFLSKNQMADIRPELLENVVEGGRFQPRSPVLRRFGQATLLRGVIRVG